MDLRGKGFGAACVVTAACAIGLSACGGSGGKKPHATAGASGASGATGTTGAAGTSGASSPTGATGAGANTGGSSVPTVKTTKPSRKSVPATPPGSGTKTTAQADPRTKSRKNSKTNTSDEAVNPYQQPTKAELKVLYKQAKDVCKYLTLDGLAREYRVQATPDAVATAYAKGYPKPSRHAVYRGCKAGVT
jgi:hypothetical protein